MNINLTGSKALECILFAKGINIPANVLIAVCNEHYNNGVIEFTKLTKERICRVTGIKVDMLNKYIKKLADNEILLPMAHRGAYMLTAEWVLELQETNFNVNVLLSTEAKKIIPEKKNPLPKDDDKAYEIGILTYNEKKERFTITSPDKKEIINEELHCGNSFEVFYKDTWKHTRIEMKRNNKGEDYWYLVGINKRKLENLKVRVPID